MKTCQKLVQYHPIIILKLVPNNIGILNHNSCASTLVCLLITSVPSSKFKTPQIQS